MGPWVLGTGGTWLACGGDGGGIDGRYASQVLESGRDGWCVGWLVLGWLE